MPSPGRIQFLEDHVRQFIEAFDPDPDREGLVDTPKRSVKAWEYILSGYDTDLQDLARVFNLEEQGLPVTSEMVILDNIELYSVCEHHLLPFYGKAHVGYIPDKIVIGASKMARIVDAFAMRLQIQERLTFQIVDALDGLIKPKGVGCIIEAEHLCMKMRGVEKQNSIMKTSAMSGVFLENASTRSEFLQLLTLRK